MSRSVRGSRDLLRAPPTTGEIDASTHLPIEYLAITAHTYSAPRLFLFYVLSILTFGILPVVAKHYMQLWTFIARAPCQAFRDAEYVLVLRQEGGYEEIEVQRIYGRMTMREAGGEVVVNMETLEAVEGEKNKFIDPSLQPTGVNRVFAYFEFKKQRYVFREGSGSFLRMSSKLTLTAQEIHELRYGMSSVDTVSLLERNGMNKIDIEPTPIWKMLVDKITHPFYIFQIFSVIIWTYELYYLYSSLIAITSSASIFWEIYLAKTNESALRDLVEHDDSCTVLRDGQPITVQVQHLVVGDAVIIDKAGVAVADMVLIQGDCAIDESSLTGESVPVVKYPIGAFDKESQPYKPEAFRSNTIYGGSIIQEVKPAHYPLTNPGESDIPRVIGIVTATGFNSTKGELFRSILYPTKIDFKFYRDSFFFVAILTAIGLVAVINRLLKGLRQDYGTLWAIVTALDLVTIAVPPALPLVLTVGVTLALRRLKSSSIFCIAPERINFAGRIDVFCWDKTGTLTTSTCQWAGLERCQLATLKGFEPHFNSNKEGAMEQVVAACHSLNDVNGHLVGSHLEQEIFRHAGWTLAQDEYTVNVCGHSIPVMAIISKHDAHAKDSLATQPTSPQSPGMVSPSAHNPKCHEPDDLFVLRRFEFEAHLQRSSVVYTVNGSDKLYAAVKGSPEAVRNLCKLSTLPLNYHEVYTNYAAKGWYVLAYATRVLEVGVNSQKPSQQSNMKRSSSLKRTASLRGQSETQNYALREVSAESIAGLQRDQVERDLKFEGFVMLKNPLKSESMATISILKEAGVKSVIITGDSSMTAISVARELELCKDVLMVDMYDKELGFKVMPNAPLPIAVTDDLKKSQQSLSNGVRSRPRSATVHGSAEQLSRNGPKSSAVLEDDEREGRGSNQKLNNRSRPSSARGRANASGLVSSASFDNIAARKRLPDDEKPNMSELTYPMEELGKIMDELSGAEIVVTGAALDRLTKTMDDWYMEWLISNSRVFARVKPNQKAYLVEQYIKMGKYVGMCGDGANDTGALKAAHVGLALSDAEASIVAPFTSAKKLVSDVPRLISEGRCALDTSFIAFKYMFMYPVLQLALSATANQLGSGLSNNQFLFDDMLVVLVLAILMLRTSPPTKMGPFRPTDTLFSPIIIASLIGHVIICLGFFAINLVALVEQDWYCSANDAKSGVDPTTWLPLDPNAPQNVSYPCYPIRPVTDTVDTILVATYETTWSWLFTHFQFAILSLTFIASSKFRKPLYTHLGFLAYFVFINLIMILLMLSPDAANPSSFVAALFSLRFPDPSKEYAFTFTGSNDTYYASMSQFGVTTLSIVAANFITCVLWEAGLVDRVIRPAVEKYEATEREKIDRRVSRRAAGWSGDAPSVPAKLQEKLKSQDGSRGSKNSIKSVKVAGGEWIIPMETNDDVDQDNAEDEAAAANENIRNSQLKNAATRLGMAAAMKVARSWSELSNVEEGSKFGGRVSWRAVESPESGAFPDSLESEQQEKPRNWAAKSRYSDR